MRSPMRPLEALFRRLHQHVKAEFHQKGWPSTPPVSPTEGRARVIRENPWLRLQA